MIGQENFQNRIRELVELNKYPRFLILLAPRGGGKTYVCKWIAKQLEAQLVISEPKADAVRAVIESAYKVAAPTLYVFPNAQSMSNVAQNAILKVTEEPPNNAYFIITAETENQLLGTLRSRGTTIRLDSYSGEEIYAYANATHAQEMTSLDVKQIVIDICETPGEVDLLMQHKVIEFWDFVTLVIDNIAEVSGSNSFKMADKINMADVSDKYDLRLFWKAFITQCMQRLVLDPIKFGSGAQITGKSLQDLRVVGINKQMLFDKWLLDIRKKWMELGE